MNVYAKFYQNISTVQEIGPVSFFSNIYIGKIATKLYEKGHLVKLVTINVYAKLYRNIIKIQEMGPV